MYIYEDSSIIMIIEHKIKSLVDNSIGDPKFYPFHLGLTISTLLKHV